MKIRRCAHCAQLIHFDLQRPRQRCWNCRELCDVHARPAPEEVLVQRVLGLVDNLPLCSSAVGLGRIALAAAFPIAVFMLLICNSFDIRLVDEPASSFIRRWQP